MSLMAADPSGGTADSRTISFEKVQQASGWPVNQLVLGRTVCICRSSGDPSAFVGRYLDGGIGFGSNLDKCQWIPERGNAWKGNKRGCPEVARSASIFQHINRQLI